MDKVFKKSVYMLMSFILLITMFAFPIGDQTAHADDVTFNEEWASMPVMPNMGVNLPADIAPYAFVDVFKWSRPFRGVGTDATFMPLDENGWPNSDARAILFDYQPSVDDPNAKNILPDISGTYHLSFKGKAELSPNNGSNQAWTLENKTYDEETNTTTADFIIPPFTGSDYTYYLLVINFTDTRKTADAELNTGISDIKLLKPGYTGDKADQVFTDEFLDALKPFSTLRFYEWNLKLGYLEYCKEAAVNNECEPNIIDWDDRRSKDNTQFFFDPTPPPPAPAPPSQIAWQESFAWEYIVELANVTGKDAWINIPAQASEDYITELAEFMKENLHEGIHIYLENSNEVWGGLSQPEAYNLNAACVEVTGKLCAAGLSNGGSESNLNDPPTNVQDVWSMRLYARRTMEISNIFTDVFGEGSLNTIIRPVLAWQHVSPTGFNTLLTWLNNTYGDPSNYLYGLASGIYMKCPASTEIVVVDKEDPNKTQEVKVNKDDPEQYDACFRENFDTASFDYISQDKAVADAYNLAYVAYEGGTSTGGGGTDNLQGRIAAERSPAITNLIKDFLNRWATEGGGLFNYFNLAVKPTRFGNWGLIEDLSDVETPKTRAIYELGADPATAPTNLEVAMGASGVTLSWDGDVISGANQPYNYETGPTQPYKYVTYNVFRSESEDGPFKLLKRGLTTTSYLDTSSELEFDTPYYYKVTAVNFGGSADSSVEPFVMESSDYSGFLFGYEPFDYEAGAGLEGLDGGYGWNGTWQTQSNIAGDIYVTDTNPLAFGGVDTEGNYVANPVSTVQSSMYRKFDLSASGAFKDYADTSNNRLYQPGATLWASAVLRAETNTENQFSWRPFVGASYGKFVNIGYMGKKDTDGNKTWNVYDKGNNIDVATNKPIVPGESVLAVVKMEFNSTTKVSYYLNPVSEGEEPVTPDYTATFSYPVTAKIDRALIHIAKDAGSIDEIRYGNTFSSVTPGINSAVNEPPVFTTHPQSAVVSLGSSVTLESTVADPLAVSYQWYKDGEMIEGATKSSFTIKNFQAADTGSYMVEATNSEGTAESHPAVLTLGAFTGFHIERTSQAPVIGEFDSLVWANAQSYPLENNVQLTGGLDLVPPADHSGSVKALWDDDYLYLLYDITDDALVAYDPIGPTRDDVELFLDRDNSKDGTYGEGDYQFIFAYDDTVGADETKHGATTDVTYKSMDKSAGFLLEARIPWTTIGMTPTEGALLGWDMASDDTDGSGRESKIAWHTNDNDIWQYPYMMGVAKLMAGDSTPDPDPDPGASLEAYIGEDFDLTLGLSGVTQDFNTLELNIQYDPAKLEFATVPLNSPDHPEAVALDADAISIAPENTGLRIAGTAVLPNGTIHIIAINTGGGMITTADKLFTLHGVVKSGLAEGTTTLLQTDAVITEGDNEYPADNNSYVIALKMRVVVNTTALASLIDTAQGVLNAAITGTQPGQYPASAKTALQNAISQAQAVLGQTTADQYQVNQAVNALQQALNVFNGSVNVATLDKTELTDMISKAQAKYNAMEEGTKVTQYKSGTKAPLHTAISQATSTLSSATSQQDLDDAVTALESAMLTSDNRIVTLVSGETQITIKDLALLAKYYEKTREEADWDLYDTADLYGDGITIQVVAKVARLLLDDWLSQQ